MPPQPSRLRTTRRLATLAAGGSLSASLPASASHNPYRGSGSGKSIKKPDRNSINYCNVILLNSSVVTSCDPTFGLSKNIKRYFRCGSIVRVKQVPGPVDDGNTEPRHTFFGRIRSPNGRKGRD